MWADTCLTRGSFFGQREGIHFVGRSSIRRGFLLVSVGVTEVIKGDPCLCVLLYDAELSAFIANCFAFLPTKRLRVHMNSFKRARASQIEFEWSVGFWGEGKTGVPGEKPLGAKERTKNKLNPHMAWTPGFEPGPHWWEASALTTAPSLAGEVYVVLLFEFFEIFLVCVVDIRPFLLGM